MSLLFPYLFPKGVRHYSLVDKTATPLADSSGKILAENEGGIAEAS